MSKKNTLLTPNFNQNFISDNQFSEELSKEILNDDTITISFDSETQNLEYLENDNSNQNNEEWNDYPIEITKDDDDDIETKKSKTKYRRKNASNEKSQNIFLYKKKAYKSESKEKKGNRKNINKNEKKNSKEKKSLNSKELSKLDDCYEKLRKLISRNDFVKIQFLILKILNGIDESDKEDDKLFKEIKNIMSNIKNKESIIIMCLGILFSNNSLNKELAGNQKENKNKKKKEENISKVDNISNSIFEHNNFLKESEEIEEIIEGKKGHNVKLTLINGVENFQDKEYSFGKHYHNYNNQIYCFFPKVNNFNHRLTLYCCRNYDSCQASCLVKKNSNEVNIKREHNHNQGISKLSFYSKFPCLINKEWEHIQIFKGNNEEIIVIQN